ncbi:hypothetical protein ACUXZ5_03000 [Alloscardovia omnicolens]|uniref:Restriction endonuclease type IV Mrr domain-containing protein n=1 Tax=Alloscardovia omnicolens TaxID=419015 RepID=A0A2I1M1D4_9BIFI|nr:hypothetical protein [Alloscardovia omnicolens]MDU3532137.1 hypothetical protein [Alloscardovia omnicolens]PKZ13953.1 hypothetical protein CYJ32_07870 [Alloscardovia omnicolens]
MVRNRKSAKKAGASFETAIANYLAWALDDERVERRHLSGVQDRGDITGVMLDGQRVVIECKNTSRMNVSEHLREAELERGNDDATYGVVVQKRHGIGITTRETVGQQLVMMTLEQYALMLNHSQPLGTDNN